MPHPFSTIPGLYFFNYLLSPTSSIFSSLWDHSHLFTSMLNYLPLPKEKEKYKERNEMKGKHPLTPYLPPAIITSCIFSTSHQNFPKVATISHLSFSLWPLWVSVHPRHSFQRLSQESHSQLCSRSAHRASKPHLKVSDFLDHFLYLAVK